MLVERSTFLSISSWKIHQWTMMLRYHLIVARSGINFSSVWYYKVFNVRKVFCLWKSSLKTFWSTFKGKSDTVIPNQNFRIQQVVRMRNSHSGALWVTPLGDLKIGEKYHLSSVNTEKCKLSKSGIWQHSLFCFLKFLGKMSNTRLA